MQIICQNLRTSQKLGKLEKESISALSDSLTVTLVMFRGLWQECGEKWARTTENVVKSVQQKQCRKVLALGSMYASVHVLVIVVLL